MKRVIGEAAQIKPADCSGIRSYTDRSAPHLQLFVAT